jgi:hypothetical protein
LLKEGAWELCTLFDVNFQPTHMSVSELETGFRKLAQKIYSDEFTRERQERYFATSRQARQPHRAHARSDWARRSLELKEQR